MAYLGKTYSLEKQENFDQFLASLNVPQERIEGILSEKSTQALTKNGDSYTLTLNKQPVTFQSGVEFNETINGKEAKTTIVVDGDTVTQVQKFPDGRSMTFKREYSGDKLVVTITNSAWDGIAKRYYSA